MTKPVTTAITWKWVQRATRNIVSPARINTTSTVMAGDDHENDSLNRRLQATQLWCPQISRKYSF